MAFDPKNYLFSTGEHENRKVIFKHYSKFGTEKLS